MFLFIVFEEITLWIEKKIYLLQTDLGIVMDSNEHKIDNKHPEEIEQQIKNDQTYDELPQGI